MTSTMTESALSTTAADLRPTQGDYELEERSSLRRIAGLSTELADVTEVEYRQLRLERVVLVGVWTEGSAEQASASLVELDRRRIRNRMAKLRREISGMKQVRATQRGARRRHDVPSVAIVGYTNAGKSSLLNALTGAGVLVEDALFATLDPTTRRLSLSGGDPVLLTDTVGFVP